MQNWDLAYSSSIAPSFPLPCHCEAAFAAVAISRYNLTMIIAHKIEVSANNVHTLNIFLQLTFYQEIATGLMALAMTVVVVTRLRRFNRSDKLKFETQ